MSSHARLGLNHSSAVAVRCCVVHSTTCHERVRVKFTKISCPSLPNTSTSEITVAHTSAELQPYFEHLSVSYI
ncbi:hypothetical protein L208DRAFT_1406054 [Tricholoma matsutake]|nr:hypothetical protein L208DRAFT_1406054 [Tricholoma matsutake 945]